MSNCNCALSASSKFQPRNSSVLEIGGLVQKSVRPQNRSMPKDPGTNGVWPLLCWRPSMGLAANNGTSSDE